MLIPSGRSWSALMYVLCFLSSIALTSAQDDWDDDWDDEELPSLTMHGFAEAALGLRSVEDPVQPDDVLLSEVRFRLELAQSIDEADLRLKADFNADEVGDHVDIDIRQALITLRAASWLDIRAGRQILTWGTGDLLFLNDLFPKDFVSFFIGRADEYLKAPSNALKLSLFSDALNADIVVTPVFTPDRAISGARLSFFSPMLPGRLGRVNMPQPLEARLPTRSFGNAELALRLFRRLGGVELAAYLYRGFSKQPLAFDSRDSIQSYAALNVYGASLRGSLFGGIASLEGAYYDSRRDKRGTDPNLPNSQMRLLAGHERSLAAQLNLGLQYYLEWTQDHDALLANSAFAEFEPEEFRHLLTSRLQWRTMQETLTLSLFAFVTIGERDFHLRPSLTRSWSDALTFALGANLMWGDDHRFFGQLADNSNVYLRLRYAY